MPARRPSASRARVGASDRVRAEWGRRVEAEYRSAAITQHLTLWLIQIGASPDLIAAGLAIVADELEHARLSHRVLVAAGGQGAPIGVRRDDLGLVRREGEPLEHDVARAAVEVFCLHETVAVPLFAGLRAGCRVPVARRALDRVLRDEVRHRDFGWTLLGALLDGPLGAALGALVAAELPAMMRGVVAHYVAGGAAGAPDLDDDEVAWGLMPGPAYARIAERTARKDYLPRFARHGLDAAAAWRAALAATSPA